jgi:hypothetical protein
MHPMTHLLNELHMTLINVTSVTHDTSVTPVTCVTLCHNVTLCHEKVLNCKNMQKLSIKN